MTNDVLKKLSTCTPDKFIAELRPAPITNQESADRAWRVLNIRRKFIDRLNQVQELDANIDRQKAQIRQITCQIKEQATTAPDHVVMDLLARKKQAKTSIEGAQRLIEHLQLEMTSLTQMALDNSRAIEQRD